MKDSGEGEGEVEIEVGGQPCPAANVEDVSKVATVGDEHVAGELMPEGVPKAAEGVGFGDGAVKWWPVLWWRKMSAYMLHRLRSLDYDLWLTTS